MLVPRALKAPLAAVISFGVLLAACPAWAIDPPPPLRDYGPMWGRGGWDGWEAHVLVMWPVFLLLAAVGAIFLAMRLYHEFWPGSPHVNPRAPVASGHQILAERFARGEIDEGEYRAKRKALGKR